MDAHYKSYQAYVYQYGGCQFIYLFNGGVYLSSMSWVVPTSPIQDTINNLPLYSEGVTYYSSQNTYNNHIHNILETHLLGIDNNDTNEPPRQRRRLLLPVTTSVTSVTSVTPAAVTPAVTPVVVASVAPPVQNAINNEASDTDTDNSVEILAPATPIDVAVTNNDADGVVAVADTPVQNMNLNCEICNAPPNSGCFHCVNCRDDSRASGMTPCGHPICMNCYTYMRNLTVIHANRHIIRQIPYNEVYNRQNTSVTSPITCIRCSECRQWHTVASYYRPAPTV